MVVNGVTKIDLPSFASDSPPEVDYALPCFIAGAENRLAAIVVQRLLSGNGLSTVAQFYNPIVLVGPSGGGKSHLARGIARRLTQLHGEKLVAYYTAKDFGRELSSARKDNLLADFQQQLQTLSMLIVEDLQQLPQSDFIQRTLRDTIDQMASSSIVLFTSQQAPPTLAKLDAGLRDRLESGLVVRLRPPGPKARREILRQSAALRCSTLKDDQLSNLAERLDGSVPLLQRALSELELKSASGEPVAACREPLQLRDIIAVVARYCSLTQAAIRSPARRKSLVYTRGIVVHLARSLTELSYAQIGQGLGRRDHTTILHAHRSIQQELATNAATQEAIANLQRILSTSR